ncbi:MAG: peptide ABC transporter substrate-binding protein [Pyrinomonadaceae bacterium]
MNSPKKIAKLVLWSLCMAFALSGCAEMGELQKPVASGYYGVTAPAANGEFRWANGNLPKTFDPALAQSPSEMQAVRATFDGLTEWNAKTLEAMPSLALEWEASEDFRTWTFHLRPVVWSNGKQITAQDFVRSWERLKEFGANSPHQQLISNIIGSQQAQSPKSKVQSSLVEPSKNEAEQSKSEDQKAKTEELIQNPKSKIQSETWFGVEAVDDATLRIYLISPDQDFPKLAAHSALRPVSGAEGEFGRPETAAKIVTSGAFQIVSYDLTGVRLERSKNYWNASAVKLEHLRFVPTKDTESALAAYRSGEVDAVTNAHIVPLALKLFATYHDFERTTYNAVTFYEFNGAREPFGDRRVREALAIAIDRERLVNDELDGAMFPAQNFLPNSVQSAFKFDPRRAQNILASAGFPSGKDFPKIKLLVNRNDTAHRLAKAVAAQWQKNLGVETEIVTSSLEELESSASTKEFDLVRRVVVLPTTDEYANLQAMFKRTENSDLKDNPREPTLPPNSSIPNELPTPSGFPIPLPTLEPIEDAPQINEPPTAKRENGQVSPDKPTGLSEVEKPLAKQTAEQSLNLNEIALINEMSTPILSELQAFDEIPAIPLYFPSSYALVKPYVNGFDANLLDAPDLKAVEIQSNWQASPN